MSDILQLDLDTIFFYIDTIEREYSKLVPHLEILLQEGLDLKDELMAATERECGNQSVKFCYGYFDDAYVVAEQSFEQLREEELSNWQEGGGE